MKKLMAVLAICSASYALNAPYLISATALSDSSVSLSWRNNDAGTVGYLLQRKDSTETVYHFVDSVKTATQLTYTDLKNLRPTTLYTYQIIAYSATEVSDTSNGLQVTTPARVVIFKKPSIILSVWNYDTSTNSLRITIFDSSDCEIGYRIYREEKFSSTFNLIYEKISAHPENMDTIAWLDTTLLFNKWYTYKTEVYKSDSALSSIQCTTYTLHSLPQQQITTFQKLSDFPISDSGSWSAQAGDSIILKETNSPAGMFTVINVSNPSSPSFAGYIDSAAALSYPQRTHIPVILRFGIYNTWQSKTMMNFNNRILVASGNLLRMYRTESDSLVFLDSILFPSIIPTMWRFRFNTLVYVNDTFAVVRYGRYMGTHTTTRSYYQPVHLSPSGLFSFPEHQFYSWGSGYDYLENAISYFHGCTDGNILMSAVIAYGGEEEIIIYNVSNDSEGRIAQLPGNIPYANAFSTGYYLSPTENLCTNGPPVVGGTTNVATEVFSADVKDVRGYQTATLNNAIYRDTIHKQNQLQNILLDTANKRVFLIFTNNMSILSYYDSVMTAITSHAGKLPSSRGLVILPGPVASSVTIMLPAHMRSADLCFYDLSGRVVDKMQDVTSNAVLWRPKTRTMSCYLVMVRSGSDKYTAKFMVR